MIKISVIVPCFQRIDQTIKTIDLIIRSNGFDKDYQAEIIVADSSPDDQLKKAVENKFKNKVIYTRPEKPGIATNKNQGARIAKNPILIFCDSDMEVETDTILNTLNALKKNRNAGAIGGQVIWRTGPKDDTLDRPRKEDRMTTINGTTYTEAIYSRYLATYKEVFWTVGGYDEEIFNMRGEGSDLSIRYWRAGYPLVYNDSIVIHHVHQTEGGVIRGVPHPEWGIAKDLLLLAYKYNMFDGDFQNFINTTGANFSQFGQTGYYRIIQGIGKYLDFITAVKPKIDEQKKISPVYDFKFLEIFSQKDLFNQCIQQSGEKLQFTRNFFKLSK